MRNLPETSQSCNFSIPPGVTFTRTGGTFHTRRGEKSDDRPTAQLLPVSRPPLPFAAAPYAHSMRLVELPRSIRKRTRQAVACPQHCRRRASVRHRSRAPSPTDPAELATPNSALRGCRARPTRSYALRKPIATPRQPRTTRVRAVRPAVSVTVSARQTPRHIFLCGRCQTRSSMKFQLRLEVRVGRAAPPS